jgi:hypothetical protein
MVHLDVDPEQVYDKLRDAGLGSVAMEMRTVADVEAAGEILVLNRAEIGELARIADEPASGLPSGPGSFVALVDGGSRVLDALSRFDPSSTSNTFEVAGRDFHFVSGIRDIEGLPVGYDDDRVRELTERGIEVIARVPEGFNDFEFLIAELGRLETQFGVQKIIFTGDRAPSAGSPENKQALAGWLRDHGFVLLLIEFLEQDGIDTYIKTIDRGIRLHSIDLGLDPNVDVDIDRAVRAIKERNIRIIFVRADETLGAPGRVDQTVALLSGIRGGVPGGLRAGVSVPFAPLVATPLLNIGALVSSVAIAALAGGLLGPLFALLVGGGTALLGVAALATGAAWIGDPFRLGIAILSAVLALYVARPTRHLGTAAVEYLKAGFVMFAGGLTLTALAYDNQFLLNADDFWGVKALLLAPLVIAGAFAAYQSLGRPAWADAGRVIRMPVEAWHLLALAAAGFVIWYFLLRSGNTGAASDFELTLRQDLEDLVYVRPRTKEFLIGFPALLAGIVLAARTRHGWWLYAVAAVGTASAIDTFTHFHTPLLVSMLRTGLSLALGLAIGLAALALLVPVERWVRRAGPFRSP